MGEMRQRVKATQIGGLASAERELLTAWRLTHNYPDRLTIGQLIHFLADHGEVVQIQCSASDGPDEPLDALWATVVTKLGQLAQAQPVKPVRDLQAKWEEWQSWFTTIDEDVTQILIRRTMWRVMIQVWSDAPEEGPLRKRGGPYMTWLAGMYTQSQSSGVRRHADTRADVVTLKRILEDILMNYDVVERYREEPRAVAEIQQEITRLDQLAEAVIDFTNKQIAHLDPKQLQVIPTFGDLDVSIDQLYRLLRKCNLILNDADLQQGIVDTTVWQEILYHPWVTRAR